MQKYEIWDTPVVSSLVQEKKKKPKTLLFQGVSLEHDNSICQTHTADGSWLWQDIRNDFYSQHVESTALLRRENLIQKGSGICEAVNQAPRRNSAATVRCFRVIR